MSICLSKGLGAPAGSVLVGSDELIAQARRWRKMLGGGMRQVGIIAASGMFALQHHVDRLEIDHSNASNLGDALSQLEHISLAEPVQTNMVMLDLSGVDVKRLRAFLLKREIQISGPRLVTHLDISAEDIDVIIGAFRQFEEVG